MVCPQHTRYISDLPTVYWMTENLQTHCLQPYLTWSRSRSRFPELDPSVLKVLAVIVVQFFGTSSPEISYNCA